MKGLWVVLPQETLIASDSVPVAFHRRFLASQAITEIANAQYRLMHLGNPPHTGDLYFRTSAFTLSRSQCSSVASSLSRNVQNILVVREPATSVCIMCQVTQPCFAVLQSTISYATAGNWSFQVVGSVLIGGQSIYVSHSRWVLPCATYLDGKVCQWHLPAVPID
jgi:hypothetical protein